MNITFEHQHRETALVSRGMQVANIGSSYLSLQGFLLLLPFATAFVLAATTLGLQVLGLGFLLRTVGKCDRTEREVLMATIGVPLLFLIGITSTLVGGYSIAAPEAQKVDMVHLADESISRTQAARLGLRSDKSLALVLGSAAASLEQSAVDEKESGRFSSKPSRGHRGKVHGDLRALASSFDRAERLVSQSIAARERQLDRAADLSLQLRGLADDPQALGSLEETRAQFARVLLEVGSLQSQASVSTREEALFIVDSGLQELASSPITTRSRREKERQRVASAAIQTIAEGARERLDEVLASAPAQSREEPGLRLMLPLEAISEYAVSAGLLIFWVYVGALDLVLPLIALAICSTLAQATRGTPSANDRIHEERGAPQSPDRSADSGLQLAPTSALGALHRQHATEAT